MGKRPVTTAEATLAAGIVQALIARGDFAKGSFDKLFPEGVDVDAAEVKTDPKVAQGIVIVTLMSLTAARTAIDMVETLAEHGTPPVDGEEWKKGKPSA